MDRFYLGEGIDEQTRDLTDERKRGILCDNVAELYNIDLETLQESYTRPKTG